MLNQQIISTSSANPLHFDQTVAEALRLLEQEGVRHWPVVQDGIYKGLISEEDLMDADVSLPLGKLQYELLPFAVPGEEHMLSALRLVGERHIDVVPVIAAGQEYLGIIEHSELLYRVARWSGALEGGGLIVLEVDPVHFSPGEISRLVETNDAQIRQFNSYIDETSGKYIVTIRINKIEISAVVATLQRYDYSVVHFAGEEQYENELRRNYHHLLHFLDM